jgi:protein TonB
VEPDNPKIPQSDGTDPVVRLHVLVGKDGLVKNVKVIQGVTGYNDPAVEAVKKWVYKPALSNNKPVIAWIEVPFRFPQ